MKQDVLNNESGIALVIALVVLLALTVMGISAMTTTTLDIRMSGNERRAAETLQIADSGIERGFLDLLTDFDFDQDWSNNPFKWRSDGTVHDDATFFQDEPFGTFPSDDDWGNQWGDPFSEADLAGTIGSTTDLYGAPIEFGDGRYRVLLMREAGNEDEVYLRSYAEHSTGARKIIQLHLDIDKVDAWRNAVFAGRGSGSNVITGNLTVGGSIHILGTGDEDVVFALSGNAKMLNGYEGLASDIKGRIPVDYIKTITIGGVEVETLEGILRVKRGKIKISGSANIGMPGTLDLDGDGTNDAGTDPSGAKYKSNMDAVYANEGFTDDSTMGNVFADNVDISGTSTDAYDLGDKVQMPTFIDSYDGQTDRAGGVCDPGTCSTYGDYIDNMSAVAEWDDDSDPDTPDVAVCDLIPFKIDADPGTPGFCAGCDSAGECVEDLACEADWDNPSHIDDCGDRNGCIKWDPGAGDGGTMEIQGRVKLDSPDCAGHTMGRSGDHPINYKGKGLLSSSADINIAGHILSSTDVIPDDGLAGKFVEDHLLAVMTKGNIVMDANIDLMGAFFAVDDIASGNNTVIVGAMMSNSFTMPGGAGSAAVYHVDRLSDELTAMGMLKSSMVYSFRTYAWSEVY